MIRKSMRWIALVVALGVVATVAYAAKYPGVVINPPEKGDYVYWVAEPKPAGKDAKAPERQFLGRDLPAGETYLVWPTAFKGDSVEVSDIEVGEPAKPATTLETGTKPPANAPKGAAPAEPPSVIVGLYDVKGNLAGEKTVKLDPKAAVAVSFDTKDFDHVGCLTVDVGELKSGVLEMTGEEWATTVTLVPADDGKVSFFFVPIASVQATLRYDKTEEKSLKFDVETPEAGAIQTVRLTPKGYERPETEAAGTGKHGRKAAPPTSGVASLLRGVLALVLLAVVVWLVYRWVKAKNVTLGNALQKLGVHDVPPMSGQDPTAAAAAVAPPLVAEGVCEFCGQTKDASGNCGCTLAGGAIASPAAPMGMAATSKLIGTLGPAMNQVFPLTDTVTIGREPDNTIPLTQDTTVSRHHAKIERSADGHMVVDLGSSNGTYVNGARVTQQALRSGDEVRVGASGFRFEVS